MCPGPVDGRGQGWAGTGTHSVSHNPHVSLIVTPTWGPKAEFCCSDSGSAVTGGDTELAVTLPPLLRGDVCAQAAPSPPVSPALWGVQGASRDPWLCLDVVSLCDPTVRMDFPGLSHPSIPTAACALLLWKYQRGVVQAIQILGIPGICYPGQTDHGSNINKLFRPYRSWE